MPMSEEARAAESNALWDRGRAQRRFGERVGPKDTVKAKRPVEAGKMKNAERSKI